MFLTKPESRFFQCTPRGLIGLLATIILTTAATCDGQNIIDPGRTTVWNPGLNAVGGIPNRTTIYATLTPSGGDDTAALQQTIAAAGSVAVDEAHAQVIQLSPGNFNFASTVNLTSYVTVRGSVDASGRPSTRIVLPNTQNGPIFLIGYTGLGSLAPSEGSLIEGNALAQDAHKGDYSVVLSASSDYAVGELITLDQLYDVPVAAGANPYAPYNDATFLATDGPQPDPSVLLNDRVWLNPSHFYLGNAPTNRNLFCITNRMIGQVLEIAAINGTTLTFSTPLHADYPVSLGSRVWRHAYWGTHDTIVKTPVKYAGVENIYMEGGNYGGYVEFDSADYSWVSNIEAARSGNTPVTFSHSFRCVLRDSYLHQTQNPSPGGGGYAVDVSWHSSDNLIENNIIWAFNKVMVMRSSGGGNVVGYNFVEDGFGFYYLTIPESGLNASHYCGSHMELFEGNKGWDFAADPVWGNSLYITAFRNHLTTLRGNVNGTPYTDASGVLHTGNNFENDSSGRKGVLISAGHNYYNMVGNVIGFAGMPVPAGGWHYETTTVAGEYANAIWSIGTDPQNGSTQAQCDQTRQLTYRHGNYDYFTNSTLWDPTNSDHTLPNSLYLTAKPAFFDSNAWPWVTPENTSAPLSGELPAETRFNTIISSPIPTLPQIQGSSGYRTPVHRH